MAQPIKNKSKIKESPSAEAYKKKRKQKRVEHKTVQPTRNPEKTIEDNIIKKVRKPRKKKEVSESLIAMKKVLREAKKANKEQFGTSKLEMKFATEFLDKLGIRYVYQYKMESIGRFLDFMCNDNNQGCIAIEVDGDFWHSYNVLEEDMTVTQKHNHEVDKLKDRWCLENCIPLLRIWEHDINDHPVKVIKILKKAFGIKIKGTPIKNKNK